MTTHCWYVGCNYTSPLPPSLLSCSFFFCGSCIEASSRSSSPPPTNPHPLPAAGPVWKATAAPYSWKPSSPGSLLLLLLLLHFLTKTWGGSHRPPGSLPCPGMATGWGRFLYIFRWAKSCGAVCAFFPSSWVQTLRWYSSTSTETRFLQTNITCMMREYICHWLFRNLYVKARIAGIILVLQKISKN